MALGALLVVVSLTALVVRIVTGGEMPFTKKSRCTVVGTSYTFSTEQAANAATIAAAGIRRELPPRAVTIALATSMQESKLINVDYGDRDSLGLFQQRPSQGWGSTAEISDPRYAAGKFYDTLVEVPGWQELPLTEAAQAVQRSGFPEAYARWEPRAQALGEALVGQTPAGLTCEFPEGDQTRQVVGSGGLTARAGAVLEAFTADVPGAERVAGRDTMLEVAPANWSSASWLVANAHRLDIEAVSFGGRTWTREDGWKPDQKAPADRVRVDVSSGG